MQDADQNFEDTATIQRQAWVPIGVGAALIAACWTNYVAAKYFDHDFLHHGEPPDSVSIKTYLVLAIAATILGVPIALAGFVKLLRLSRRGVTVDGTVARVGMASIEGVRSVTFSYVVDGREYTVTRMVADEFAACELGDKVRLVYDRANPANAEPMEYSRSTGS